MGLDPSVFVHDRALCESDEVGPRTRIWAFAHVMKGARVGEDCNVCDHVFIEDGAVVGDRVTIKHQTQICTKVTIEDEVFLGPNIVFTNVGNPRVAFKDEQEWIPTRVRRGASMGALVSVVPGVTVGENAFVGAGAVLLRDVPAFAIVVGNPARQIGWMCLCGERLDDDYHCACGRRYRLIDAETGLEPID